MVEDMSKSHYLVDTSLGLLLPSFVDVLWTSFLAESKGESGKKG